MTETPKSLDDSFARAVRGYAIGRRVERTYGPREENYDRIEDCGHEYAEPDAMGDRICIHCGTVEA